MSRKTNNLIIATWMIISISLALSIYNFLNGREDTWGFALQILTPSFFFSFAYGLFARAASHLLGKGLPKNSSAQTLKSQDIVSTFKFLRIWVELKN
jgi:hypothetical protein